MRIDRNLIPGVRFSDGRAAVRLWAPDAEKVSLVLGTDRQDLPLARGEYGYWSLETDLLQPGEHYRFRIGDGDPLPDPASLLQPEGVHGPSAAVQLDGFRWTDGEWKNPQLGDYILYELHTGTFSPEGTFDGIAKRLDHLVELGVTAVELLPVAEFPGSRNWGYDGVFPYAAHHAYGGPEGLMRLVDACHQKGLAVVLDVVYNHVGPEGNYLGSYGPYFTDKYRTPWGDAINFDDAGCDGVRNFFLQNALMWLRDFHIDALRLDAVHAIRDFGAVHLLEELRMEADALMQETGRRHYLIVESDLNDPRLINPLSAGGFGMDAQWVDEFHHALRVASGNERNGYYADFDGIAHLAKSYTDAYVYDGSYSPHRSRTFGRKSSNPGQQFVIFSQNHDQVGNRMMGERTSMLVGPDMQRLMAGAVMVSPFLPLLFMGEEWAAPNPFLYFVSHTDPELISAVREGRRKEFAAFHAEGEAPDPQSEETFGRSRLQWDLLQAPEHREMLRYYQALIALRKAHPALHSGDRGSVSASCDEERQTIVLHRRHGREHLVCLMNFSSSVQSLPAAGLHGGRKLLDSSAPEWGGPSAAPDVLTGNAAELQPASILIYDISHV